MSIRLWALSLCLVVPALAQISPGTLSRAHTSLSGPTKCSSCHVFGAGAPRFRCLSCHTEIRRRVAEKRGYHGRVVKTNTGREDCARCHTEHYGENFNIVKWDTSASEFDHREAGYPLAGKHAGLACNRCHNQQDVLRSGRNGILVKDLNRTYLGLSPACTTCHTDEHRGELGPDCERCHTLEGWKPASRFEHSASKYPLTGQHERVACAGCHKPRTENAKLFVPYTGISFATCSDCHADPHRGAFAAACQSCHVTEGWKLVRTSAATFDHDKTKFALHGAHAKVACDGCHKTSDFSKPVAHDRCADCHAPDPHKGQFAGKDCGVCHTDDAFKPSLYDVSMHQKSGYPLMGKHATVECAKCHVPAGKDTRYKIAFAACTDCHQDAHGGQFQNARYANRCDACHTVDGFQPSTFTLAKHQQTQFPLSGGHAATACGDCHRPDPASKAAARETYHFVSVTCITCHEDPHRSDAAGKQPQDCETCHNVRSWHETSAFDHSKTKFELLGAHRAVGCLECHRPVTTQGAKIMAFNDAPTGCSGCHEDIHGGQFKSAGAPAADCTSCHNLVAWKPAIFDHEKSEFSLKGAHEQVPCADCHTQRALVSGRETILYRNAPKRCVDCHAGK